MTTVFLVPFLVLLIGVVLVVGKLIRSTRSNERYADNPNVVECTGCEGPVPVDAKECPTAVYTSRSSSA